MSMAQGYDIHGRDWLDLPGELLAIIIRNLDDESLLQLSQTCRNLHYLALPVWFERNAIRSPADGWISVYRPRSEHTLRAVQMALFVQSLRSINYYLNPDVNRILGEFRELRRMAARMPPVDSLELHFTVFERWLVGDSNSQKIQLDGDAWKSQLTGMLDQFLDKGCKQLHVIGGASIWTAFTAKSTISESGMSTAGLGFRMLKALRRLWFVKLSTKGELIHSRHSNVAVEPAAAFPPKFRRKKRFSDSRTSTSFPLQEFHLHSGILLHPYFFDWTVSVFRKSQGITTLSLIADIPPSALSDLLSNITLPALSNFEISCTLVIPSSPVDFPSIESFLTRHPSIITLYLYGVLFPHKSAALKKAILPRLLHLTAHPNYVAWLLAPRDALPQIQTVTISSHYQSANVAFDHDLFDHAIRSVASINREVVFCIQLACTLRVEDWLHKHVGAGQKGSVIALLNNVKELKISCFYFFEFSPSTLEALTGFLALFPDLEHVYFTESPEGLEDLMLEQSFFKSITSQSTRIKTIQVNGSNPHELSSLRE